MDLAIQIARSDKIVGEETIRALKDSKPQSLPTQSKRGKDLVVTSPAINKRIKKLRMENMKLDAENDILKNKIIEYDQKSLKENRDKLLQKIDNKKGLIISGSKRADLFKITKNERMSHLSHNKLGRSEPYYNISANGELQDKKMTELKSNFSTKSEQSELLQNNSKREKKLSKT